MTVHAVRVVSPFRARGFSTYYVGQSISFFGDGIVPMTFAFAALAVSDSGWGMPIVLLSLWGARMLFIAPGGSLSDRYDRVAIMWLADVVRLVAQIIPFVAFATDTATLWHLGISAALYGIGTAFYVPASIGLLPELVPGASLQKANSWIDVALNTGLLAGPALATLLVTLGGVETALLFDIATFVVSLACLAALFRLRRAPSGELDATVHRVVSTDDDQEEAEEIGAGFWNGMKVLPRYPAVLALMLAWCPVQLSVAAINVLGPIVARDTLGGIGFWAALATALGAGGLIGSFLAGWVRVSRPEFVALWIIASCQPIQLVLFGMGLNIALLTAAFAVTAVLVASAGVVFDTYVQTTVPNAALSRVGAVEQTLMSVMVPIGLAISLPLAQWMGTSEYLYALAALIVVSGIIAGSAMGVGRNRTHGDRSAA